MSDVYVCLREGAVGDLSDDQIHGAVYETTRFITYLLFRCCGLPRHLNCPLTMMATRLHNDSHSSILRKKIEMTKRSVIEL